MNNKFLMTLKMIVLLFTVTLALVALLYVFEVFTDDYFKKLALKLMAVMGIVTGTSLVALLLTANSGKE